MNGPPRRAVRIPVEGGDLFAEIAGGEETRGRAPAIFLHGWTLDRRMWAPQLAAVAPARRAVAVDRRGFGRSTAPPDLRREAEDVRRIVEFLEADRAIIIGMSQAGRIALEFALAFKGRVAGLVLQGARLSSAPEEIPLDRFATLARAGRLDEMKALWRAHPLMRRTNRAQSAAIDAMLDDYDGRDLIAAASPLQDLDASALGAVAVPSLIVTGDADMKSRRDAADLIARAIAGATRAEIAGAGHLCNLCAAAEFNRVLMRHLGSIAA